MSANLEVEKAAAILREAFLRDPDQEKAARQALVLEPDDQGNRIFGPIARAGDLGKSTLVNLRTHELAFGSLATTGLMALITDQSLTFIPFPSNLHLAALEAALGS